MNWSQYQLAIFDNIKNGTGNTIVEALAGSGKTSSLIQSLYHVAPDKNWLLCAFNKKIADELKLRAPARFGDIRTIHSLGLKSLYASFSGIQIDDNKSRRIFDKLVDPKKFWDEKSQLNKTMSLCKGMLIEGSEFIDWLIDEYEIDTLSYTRDEFISLVQKGLEASRNNTRVIDFNDMIYLPNAFKLNLTKYDLVFVDECQDLNKAQVEIVLNSVKPNGRLICFGDPNQAIYKFRGACSNSMALIKERTNATTLPLPITYRCPLSVVKEAQRFVPDLQPAPGAKEGLVKTITRAEMMKSAKPGCFIISRLNAPMIGIALAFIRAGVPAAIQGKDIGSNLVNLIKKSKKKTIDSFLTWLDGWEKKEKERLAKKRISPETIKDKAACLRTVAESCSDIAGMKSKITELFEDTDELKRITLSTLHRCKGMERDIVFMLMNTFKEFDREEQNIKYCAITRSKSELYYVSK